MLKHLLVATLAVSSLAMAGPAFHPAVPLPSPPAPRTVSRPVPPPPPPVVRQSNERRPDALVGNQLLRDFDAASARRDARALSAVDHQFDRYLAQALREAGGARKSNQLMAISSKLSRLQGRFDPRSLRARRSLYVDLVQLTLQDQHGGHRF